MLETLLRAVAHTVRPRRPGQAGAVSPSPSGQPVCRFGASCSTANP